MKFHCQTFAAITVFLCASFANAEMYKWVDENGVVNYGKRPPAESSSEKLDIVDSRVGNVGSGQDAPTLANNDAGDDLNCAKAAEYGDDWIDSMLDVGRKNVKSGHMSKADFDAQKPALTKLKSRISSSECSRSSGKVREFYECLEDGMTHIMQCGQRTGYGET